ncbi:uncharacterized protein LOC129576220 [Sitodiplosis mosellana]|uniref:uncharacterized protein LOC129576220 n=1 Tax=Sitodiplosis mosellana TaxID=263140 RepID=UPI002444AF46|nr:uncharacterized protein LOC129576220 [Sitodiplosis mosellana]
MMQSIIVIIAIVASTLFVGASSAFLSDGVAEFNFTKLYDGSDEYDVEYKVEKSGKTFHGKTSKLYDKLYAIFGADNVLYWVEFTEDEYNDKRYLTKTVRLIKRSENKLEFKDNSLEYEIILESGFLFTQLYSTSWNLENICFSKSNNKNQTFDYVISARNNSRKYNGTTYIESNDPHVQRIAASDGGFKGLYEVNFTDDELSSTDTFCKGISKLISHIQWLSPIQPIMIDTNLLKSLAG